MTFLSRTTEHDFTELDKSRRCLGVAARVVPFAPKDERARGADNLTQRAHRDRTRTKLVRRRSVSHTHTQHGTWSRRARRDYVGCRKAVNERRRQFKVFVDRIHRAVES